ncbi:HPr kinase/phosphorylase [Entomoplasma ellychniae]|uniref:HPr kinase/phosphorylase n=2 Tax=Entomoplasmataceae TaxID=33925 RepID=A0A2S5RH33_9MOLU|nr:MULTISPECIES: HPr(Ser) kinase/phosphatase [Entomoplasmataceae]PPE04848.1 HPr kinase/phosphorylase [Entomoplasma ellychniae]PPE06613.1 HPr kinase/phosphorylase [Mesoplasma corruscae]
MSHFFIKDLLERIKMQVLSGKDHLDREITVYGLNRAGLELTGFITLNEDKKHKRAILLSSKESEYMKQFNDQEAFSKYELLLQMGSPVIIITKKFKDIRLVEVAKKYNFPLLQTNNPSTSEVTQKILDVYDIFFAPSIETHSTLMNIFGKGVLIFGQSGIGKSEVSLELMKKNHLFVGDDRIILTNKNSELFGKSHPMLKNLIEVRGIGIIDVSKIQGHQLIMDETKIHMGIELFKFDNKEADTTDRLGSDWYKKEFLGITIPYLSVPVSAGRNLANIIESAVGQLKVQDAEPDFDIIKLLAERNK